MRDCKFDKTFTRLLELNNLTQARFADLMQVSNGTVSSWSKGATVPCVYDLIRIANYFHVTVDFLLFDRN